MRLGGVYFSLQQASMLVHRYTVLVAGPVMTDWAPSQRPVDGATCHLRLPPHLRVAGADYTASGPTGALPVP